MKYGVIPSGDALDQMERGVEDEVAGFVTGAIREGAEELKGDWRDQIRKAKLGERLANSVRSQVYPRGQNSVDAAALVWTKAGPVIDAYANGATLVNRNGGRFIAIPTDDVPKKRRGNSLTPREVERRFGREMDVIKPQGGAPGVLLMGYQNLVQRKASGRWANASRNQQTAGHRSFRDSTRTFVVMFVLTPNVRVLKRLDLEALSVTADTRFPILLNKHWK